MGNPRFLELLKEMETMHNKKNAGYAGVGAVDPLANFKYSTLFGVKPSTGCMVRMSDKFIRISNLKKNPNANQVGESIKDTLMDLAVYCLICICLLEEEREAKKEVLVANPISA